MKNQKGISLERKISLAKMRVNQQKICYKIIKLDKTPIEMTDIIHRTTLLQIVLGSNLMLNIYRKKNYLWTGLWLNWLKFFGFRQRIFRICMLLFFGRAAWHWIMRKIWEHTMLHWACITECTSQRPRIDLNKRFLPGQNTTTAWKLIPHRSNISKN